LFRVDILATDRHRAKAYIDGYPKFVDLFNHPNSVNMRYRRRGYYLTRYGSRNTQAVGEVTNRFRQMGGHFEGWAIQPTMRGSWGQPSSTRVVQDDGYVVRSRNVHTFCVVDRARECAP